MSEINSIHFPASYPTSITILETQKPNNPAEICKTLT